MIRGHLSGIFTKLILQFLIPKKKKKKKKSLSVKGMKRFKIPTTLLGYGGYQPTWYFDLGFRIVAKTNLFYCIRQKK